MPRDSRREVVVSDLVYGTVSKSTGDLEDLALLRITDILRGQEHLANTFKHALIFEALGVDAPKTAHLPLLMARSVSMARW